MSELAGARYSSQVFHSVSSVDGRLLRSVKVLLTRPGQITNAYVLGPRKPYIGPFQLFLIVNVAFFAVQAFADSPIFSNSLHSHMYEQDWSAFARGLVDSKLAAAHTTLAFLLLCSCELLLLTLLEKWLGGSGLRSPLVDWGAFVVLTGVIATYLYIATGVVYSASGLVRALKVALLAVVIAAAVPGYRFLIFMVTLYYT